MFPQYGHARWKFFEATCMPPGKMIPAAAWI